MKTEMIKKHYNIFFLLLCFWLVACNVTKSLPEGEKLYTGASIKVKGPQLTSKHKKVLVSDLQGLARPKPNSRLLGIPFKLKLYTLFRKSKPNSFFGKIRDKNGEPPVLMSSVDLEQTAKLMQNHLENKGFFKAAVTGDTTVKKKKGSASYSAGTDYQYHIRNIMFPDDSSQLSQTIRQSATKTLLKTGQPFDLDLIKGERTRIDAVLKEKGYFFFSPDFLLAKVDSTNGNHIVDMKLVVKPGISEVATQAYRINNVYIYTGYNINASKTDTNKAYAKFYDGFYVIDQRNRFKPKLFTKIMQFRPGDLYNRTDHNQTLNRLINLNEFKFVKNRFEPIPDTSKLDVYYYLTPLRKKTLRAEITGTTKSNNMNGGQITGTWLKRNTFHAGEQLSLSAYIGSEAQFGGGSNKGYNTYRTGAELNLTFPRLIVPFFDFRPSGGYVPRTNIKLGYDILKRQKLYTLNSFRGAYGYLWKVSMAEQHELYPISVTYVQPSKVTQEYRDSVAKYPSLKHVIDSQFIIGATYQYNYNQVATGIQRTNSFYFNGLVDISGNMAGLLTNKKDGEGKEKIFNAPFDQYLKLEADFRYYRRLGLNATWANRIVLGYGLPYGNSDKIPYIKQFFSGGNNSIRAFRSRSLLGTYYIPNQPDAYPDLTGDLKLEINTEYRPRISGPIYGALFIDAGNAWLKNEDSLQPGAKFTSDFLNQLAVGAGVGLRLDIQIFVLRLDVAFPLRKPWESNPWVIDQIRLGNAQWRKDNLIYNLAIGYPF
ncbi:BamA/TamA family outer membrane protein [Chitinophagaceae bacterium LB-8]|uniref:BamA/TamA family outer membrane protein n=1 Tax=Paraflavisolibacter caeni TaxID=2982496 RepID=A0A9X2XPD8_9BACT|nr:BamA/TamA family outer membrane protein [Paraflavisolibacter caeni]MCU7551068.1 BamA/TamA family outer membrane protein [Paraflavisolibacter caeni]